MSDVVVTTAGGVLHTPAGQLPLVAHFSYSRKDPVAVAMTLVAEFEVFDGRIFTDQSTWVFARELIDEAMSTFLPSGDGDVTVTYMAVEDILRFDLTDVHDDKHALYVDAAGVVDFMADSFGMVPAEDEGDYVDGSIDDAIEQLLAGTWES